MSTTILTNAKPARVESPSLKWRREGDVILMLDENEGSIYELNITAAKAWELADGSNTLEEIADQIALEFEADLEEVKGDLVGLFRELERRGYLRFNS